MPSKAARVSSLGFTCWWVWITFDSPKPLHWGPETHSVSCSEAEWMLDWPGHSLCGFRLTIWDRTFSPRPRYSPTTRSARVLSSISSSCRAFATLWYQPEFPIWTSRFAHAKAFPAPALDTTNLPPEQAPARSRGSDGASLPSDEPRLLPRDRFLRHCSDPGVQLPSRPSPDKRSSR